MSYDRNNCCCVMTPEYLPVDWIGEMTMQISIVTETYWPEVNGVSMTLHRLVTGLLRRGHVIQLVCPSRIDRNPELLPSNVSYLSTRGLSMPGYNEVKLGLPSRRLLKRLWCERRPKVIYVATEGPLGWSAVKEANRAGIPVVSGFHTNFHSYSRHYKLGFIKPLVEHYLRVMHNQTHTTLVPTPEQKDLLQIMGIQDVTVLGRGVDTALYTPAKRSDELRQQWGVEQTDPVMIYVGRIAEEKNLDLTMTVYRAMRQINHKLKFVLVGKGPLLKELQKEYPDCIFTGTLTGEALAQHYASADLFVFTSLTETFGNVILEAMASGLAVVAYDYAAAHLHIRHDENGLLVAPGEPAKFKWQTQRLLDNDVLLKRLRSNACRYAAQHSWDIIVEQFESILQSYALAKSMDWEPVREAQQ